MFRFLAVIVTPVVLCGSASAVAQHHGVLIGTILRLDAAARRSSAKTITLRSTWLATITPAVATLFESLPGDVSYEDIPHHIYARENIERGRRAIEEGEVFSGEEGANRLSV
jgi:hypothetical protein